MRHWLAALALTLLLAAPAGGATIVSLGATWDSNASGQTVTGSPTTGDLIVVVHGGSGWASGDDSTITDNNADGLGTYTKVGASPLSNGGGTAGALWISIRDALVGSATSTIFTNTASGLTGGGLTVYRVSSMSRTGGIAAKQTDGESTQTENPPSLSFGVAPNSANPCIAGIFAEDNPPTLTAPGSWSETTDTGYTLPTSGVWVGFINSGCAQTLNWTGGAVTDHNEVAVELDTSAAPTQAGMAFSEDDDRE